VHAVCPHSLTSNVLLFHAILQLAVKGHWRSELWSVTCQYDDVCCRNMNVHVAILHTEQGCLLYYTSVWLFWLLSHFF